MVRKLCNINLMDNDQKRRKHKRIEKPYVARFRIKQYEGLKLSSTKWDMVTLKDLSAGGCGFYYNKILGLNSLLDFKIDVSTIMPTISCAGKILRSDKIQPASVFSIAIEFTEIDEQEKEIINTTVVDEFLEYKIKHF